MREGSDRSSAGVPYLRSVPLLRLLFGKRIHQDDEELVVLVTAPDPVVTWLGTGVVA
jgi:hypothetical protein